MTEWRGCGALRVVVIVLAVIGAIAVVGVAGMAAMHYAMMGGMGR